MMLNTLQTVRGAVAKKELVPVLTHFHVYSGRIQGGNGTLAIDAPFPWMPDIDITVPAERFIKAIDACSGDPKLKVTGEFLWISNQGFRAKLPLAPHEDFPRYVLEGEKKPLEFDLIPVLRNLEPFYAIDASRPWATGALLRSGAAWATNNITIAKVPIPWENRSIGLPRGASDELIRIGRQPTHYTLSDTSITFIYEDESWLRSALLSSDAPDLERFNEAIAAQGVEWYEQTEDLRKAVETIAPFCPNPHFPEIVIREGEVTTGDGEFSATVAIPVGAEGHFHLDPLLAVLRKADAIALGEYPNPVPWRSGEDGPTGLLTGLRQ